MLGVDFMSIGKIKWAALLLGVMVLVFMRCQPWDCLIGYDQAKQAFVSLEMVQDGHWWYQHLPTGKPATKPPLVGWCSAAIYPLVGGWWETAWRAPSLLAFLAILVILGKTARLVGREWGAFLAVSLFAVNMLTIRLATLVRTDMFLALIIFVGGLMIWRQIREAAPWTPLRRWCFGLVVLAGCFTKGPVMIVYLLIPLLCWRILCWRRGELSTAWPGWTPWLMPISLFLLWLGIGCALDPQFFKMVVVKEFGTNFAAISVTDAGDITMGRRRFGMMFTYPLQLIHRLFPWSLAVLLWVIFDRPGRRRLMADAGSRWLVVWIGVALVLMSLVPNKRVDRIFPIVAPFALLAAQMVAVNSLTGARRWNPRTVIGTLTICSFLIWGGYTVYWQLDHRNQEKNEELARYSFCQEALGFARTNHMKVAVLGPVSDLNQSLLTYLRCTVPLQRHELAEALSSGHAVLMPLSAANLTNTAGRVVLRTSNVTEAGSDYGVRIRPAE